MGRMRQMSAVVVAGCVLLAGCTSNNSDQAQDDTGGQATAASQQQTDQEGQQQAGQEGQSGQDGVEGRPFPGRCVHADHIDTTPVTTAPRSRWMTVQDIRVPLTEAGPFQVDGYKQRCFSPSLAGAVAAAANIGLRQAGGNPAMKWSWQHDTIPAESDAEAAGNRGLGWAELQGFRVDKVSDGGKKVVVFIGIETKHKGDIVHGGIASPVMWDGTDWKFDGKTSIAMAKDQSDGEALTGAYRDWKEQQ